MKRTRTRPPPFGCLARTDVSWVIVKTKTRSKKSSRVETLTSSRPLSGSGIRPERLRTHSARQGEVEGAVSGAGGGGGGGGEGLLQLVAAVLSPSVDSSTRAGGGSTSATSLPVHSISLGD